MAAQGQVLVVEDNNDVRDVINGVVEKMGYHPIEARTVARALSLLNNESIDLMLLDIYLKGATGLDLLKALNRRRSDIPTVVVSGFISDTVAHQLIQLGVQGVVSKPFTIDRLVNEIRKVTGEVLESEPVSVTPALSVVTEAPAPEVPSPSDRRVAPRIPMRLPVRVRTKKGERFYMKLVDLSTTGMQTLSKNLDVLKLGADMQNFAFEIPLVVHLAWVKSCPEGDFAVGWEFDEVIRPNAAKDAEHSDFDDDASMLEREADISMEKRRALRIPMHMPIRVRVNKGKYLDMDLVDISSTGMQTRCADLSMLNKASAADQRYAFEIPIAARLAWVNATSRNVYAIGWEFDQQ